MSEGRLKWVSLGQRDNLTRKHWSDHQKGWFQSPTPT